MNSEFLWVHMKNVLISGKRAQPWVMCDQTEWQTVWHDWKYYLLANYVCGRLNTSTPNGTRKLLSTTHALTCKTRVLQHQGLARFICTVCARGIRWFCEGLASIPRRIYWMKLEHLLLRLCTTCHYRIWCATLLVAYVHATVLLSILCWTAGEWPWANTVRTGLYSALNSCSCRR